MELEVNFVFQLDPLTKPKQGSAALVAHTIPSIVEPTGPYILLDFQGLDA